MPQKEPRHGRGTELDDGRKSIAVLGKYVTLAFAQAVVRRYSIHVRSARLNILKLLNAGLFAIWISPVLASDKPWLPLLIDPSSKFHGPADLILPTPCGGGMAFQRVNVPVDVARPLSDRAFRMGQQDAKTAFADYLKPTYLRGAFDDPETEVSYYYIARYELNEAQYRAISGDCEGGFKLKDGRAKGRLSWFDGVNLSRKFSEWLMQNARDALPQQGDRIGFLRMPTESEWEYAARGGAKVDAIVFAARRFFSEGALAEYAAYLAPGTGRSNLTITGAKRKPNPLGLLDIYGNAEELMLEPFRLNAIGRSHGQSGGLVTRGGSVDQEDAQIYTARRSEYPMFNNLTGQALAGEFFGVRLVIGATVVSEDRYDSILSDWDEEADRSADTETDPLATLKSLLEEEVDPRRRSALGDLQLEFRITREAAAESLFQAAKSTLLSGAAFVETLVEGSHEIRQLERESLRLLDTIKVTFGDQRTQLTETLNLNLDRLDNLRASRDTYLLSYRATLETLASDVETEIRDRAYARLTQDLSEAEQVQLLTMLNRFWSDMRLFLETPDMERDELLKIAIQ